MKISVIGFGKIGLPAAVQYASKGHDVVGADVNPAVVDLVNKGQIPAGIEGIATEFAEVYAAGKLRATTDTVEAVRTTDVTVVVVPIGAPGGKPDYRYMDAAVAAVAQGLTPGHLVVFETTVAVGDTRNRPPVGPGPVRCLQPRAGAVAPRAARPAPLPQGGGRRRAR
jgi:UDP-N-acetyl-D-glucosamine dehydrogenase